MSIKVPRPQRSCFIFCDASFHPKYKIGVGSYLILSADHPSALRIPTKPEIQVITAKVASNVRMEFVTILAAIKHFISDSCAIDQDLKQSVTIFTDCEIACKLAGRRQSLEVKNYRSLRTNRTLSNADLYQAYFDYCDKIQIETIWLKGHQAKHSRNNVQEIFALVDQTARKHLRALNYLSFQ